MLSTNGAITGRSGIRNGVKDFLILTILKNVLPSLKKTVSLSGFSPIATMSRYIRGTFESVPIFGPEKYLKFINNFGPDSYLSLISGPKVGPP